MLAFRQLSPPTGMSSPPAGNKWQFLLALDGFVEELDNRRTTLIFINASTGPIADCEDTKLGEITDRIIGPTLKGDVCRSHITQNIQRYYENSEFKI